jgi:hypothetical protein
VGIRRSLAMLVSGAILVAACNSTDNSPSVGGDPTAPGPSAATERFVEAANALVDRWAERDAFFVVMWALDLGYSPDQIIDAAVGGMLRADGTISGESGDVVAPARPPAGLLAIDGPSALTVGFVTAAYQVARDDEQSPRDAYVADMGSWLGESFDAG